MCSGIEKDAGFQSVTLLGLGVMGASLGLALKRERLPIRVTGWSRSSTTRESALAIGCVDRICETPDDAVAGAGLVVGCLPVLALAPCFRDLAPALAADAVLTDVGSTKRWLDRAIRDIFRNSSRVYIGSHPMTGTEKSGPEAASPGLYRDAPVFLTPAADDDRRIVECLKKFWQAVGARVYCLTPEEHDRRVARTSHLPHLVAAALVNAAFRDNPEGIKPFLGPGFRDTTRVAGGSPEMWHDIVSTNRDALLHEMQAFEKVVGVMRRQLESNSFDAVRDSLERARSLRIREVVS